jgi:hypothetical protein
MSVPCRIFLRSQRGMFGRHLQFGKEEQFGNQPRNQSTQPAQHFFSVEFGPRLSPLTGHLLLNRLLLYCQFTRDKVRRFLVSWNAAPKPLLSGNRVMVFSENGLKTFSPFRRAPSILSDYWCRGFSCIAELL